MIRLPSTAPVYVAACCSAFVLMFLITAEAQAQSENWPQWGGPQRNFIVNATGLAATWPAAGPKRLWSRALELKQSGGKTAVKQLWASSRTRVHHGTIVAGQSGHRIERHFRPGAADSGERQDRPGRLAGSRLSQSQFRVRRWQADSAGRRRAAGAGSSVAARDECHRKSDGVGESRVDSADAGGHESVREGFQDDHGARFEMTAGTTELNLR